jgi:hypothetical protein
VATGQLWEAPDGHVLVYIGSYPRREADTLHLFEVSARGMD